MINARTMPRVKGNRLMTAKSRYTSGTTQVTIVTNAYDGLFRRISKAVTNSGYGVVHKSDDLDGDGTPDATGIQAGDRTEHYYYAGWSLIETRNGSGYTLGQWVWGTQYIDEPVAYDRNTNLPSGGSGDNDCLDSGGSQRYTYHQDANFRVVALTNESGAVVERYDYTAYGEPTVICGVDAPSAGNESGNVVLTSRVGNPFMHQGLFRDEESGTYQNRFRQLHSRAGRFMQRDPIGYIADINLYGYLRGNMHWSVDPSGLGGGGKGPRRRPRPSTQPASQPPGPPPWSPPNPLTPPPGPGDPGMPEQPGGWPEFGRRVNESVGSDEQLPNGPGNWCTGTNDNPDGFDFSSACEKHDSCYGTPGKSKEQCDTEFYWDMVSVCMNKHSGNANCLRWAWEYWNAVHTLPQAQEAYDGAQAAAQRPRTQPSSQPGSTPCTRSSS